MSGLYFGSSERPLYGYYHEPAGPGRGAVVVCPPGAGEYQFAHRALRVLAERLAERGRHVLRFDYSGTGDSWGACTAADPDAWTGDASDAVEETRAMSGLGRVDLVGLRLGALVAARVAESCADIGGVVLWDPILDGEGWLVELGADPCQARDEACPVELGFHLVSAPFEDGLRGITAQAYAPLLAARVLLLLTQRDLAVEAGNPLAHVRDLEMERLDQPAPWVVDQSIWTGQVPTQALRRIAEWLD